MTYPTISEYIESIKYAEDNFATLTDIRPVLNADGYPIMSSGNFAVVFKMRSNKNDKIYAIKCFTREQEGRDEAYEKISDELSKIDTPFFLKTQFLKNELFVNSNSSNVSDFPVVVMEWVDGKPLDRYIHDLVTANKSLELLICRFIRLTKWLVPSKFAHGDIKPDNIIVKDDGEIVVVDYDGMYVPAMKGQCAREYGSSDFRHPERKTQGFNARIDDFSFASILLSLVAIEYDNDLYRKYSAKDRLLLSESDYVNLQKSEFLKEISLSDNSDLNIALSFFLLAYSTVDLSLCIDILNKLEDRFFLKFETYCHGTEMRTPEYNYSLFGAKYKRIKQDRKKAFNNFLVLGKMGNRDAQCCVGCCYRDGKGIENDYDKALFWYLKAINNNDTRAVGHLRGLLLDLYKKRLYSKALHVLDYVLEYGAVTDDVSIRVGFCYEYGWGADKDPVLAGEWFRKVSSASSVNRLAKSYLSGKYSDIDITPNVDKCIYWLQKGVVLKDMECIVQLGEFYEEGKYIKQSIEKANELYRIAETDFYGMCLLLEHNISKGNTFEINKLLSLILSEVIKVEHINWMEQDMHTVDALSFLKELINNDLSIYPDHINETTLKKILISLNRIFDDHQS